MVREISCGCTWMYYMMYHRLFNGCVGRILWRNTCTPRGDMHLSPRHKELASLARLLTEPTEPQLVEANDLGELLLPQILHLSPQLHSKASP